MTHADAALDLSAKVREAARRLPDYDDPAFGAAFDSFGDARIVLLGECTHGTSEFYRARAAITRRLIEQHARQIPAQLASETGDREHRADIGVAQLMLDFRRCGEWIDEHRAAPVGRRERREIRRCGREEDGCSLA